MYPKARKHICRMAIWLIVAVMVYRVGECPCECVHHSLWFDVLARTLPFETTHECDGHEHSHRHASHHSDAADLYGDQCISVSLKADLWRYDPTDEFELSVVTSTHLINAEPSKYSCPGTFGRSCGTRFARIEDSRPLRLRAAYQVFQL